MEVQVDLTKETIAGRRESVVLHDRRKRAISRAGKALVFLLLTIVAITMLLPYLFALSASLKLEREFLNDIYNPIPSQIVGDNYAEAFDDRIGRMGIYVRNSAMYAFLTLIFQLLFNSLAGFAFARLRFPGREVLFLAVLATMMLPFSVMVIPVYLIIHWMELKNTIPGVIVPSFASGFGIFLLRQFFLNQSAELEEAALIDGAGWFRVFWTISLPLARPALVALGIFIIISEWSAFLWPLIVLDDWDLFPITIGLSMYRDLQYDNWTAMFAASIVGTAPLVVIFLLAQRHIVGGIQLTGLKG